MKLLAMFTDSRPGTSASILNWQMMLACMTLLVLPGCGGGGGPSLVKAKGKLSVDGAPASGAILLFHPESPSGGNVASAIADESGMYSPFTGVDEGISEGEYRVTVVWPDPKFKSGSEGVKFGAAESKDPPDLLKGRFVAKDKSKLTMLISKSNAELKPIEIRTK